MYSFRCTPAQIIEAVKAVSNKYTYFKLSSKFEKDYVSALHFEFVEVPFVEVITDPETLKESVVARFEKLHCSSWETDRFCTMRFNLNGTVEVLRGSVSRYFMMDYRNILENIINVKVG